MDWDNLRYFLELARTGTLVSAARRLAVDHTTVARRIQALEKEMGLALFSREAGGHRLTEAGRRLQPQAEAMEEAFLAVERSAAPPSHAAGLSGLVRIGAGATRTYGTPNGLPDDFVRALHEDSQGHLWIGTRGGGVSRLADPTLASFGAARTMERKSRNGTAPSSR